MFPTESQNCLLHSDVGKFCVYRGKSGWGLFVSAKTQTYHIASNRGFHKRTKLTILALLPSLLSHVLVVSFLIYTT